MRALGKKAMWTWTDVLHFILFYVPMTAIAVLMLVMIPGNILSAQIYIGDLDNAILSNRIYTSVSFTDWNTGRLYPGVTASKNVFNASFINTTFRVHEKKPLAFNLTLGNTSAAYNQDYYEIARPLAPIRYRLIDMNKPLYILDEQKIASMRIDLVSAKK